MKKYALTEIKQKMHIPFKIGGISSFVVFVNILKIIISVAVLSNRNREIWGIISEVSSDICFWDLKKGTKLE